MILNYFRSTRAGATAIAAAAVSVMSLAATGLLIDHLWLVHKRDMLKNAADAAALAATLQLDGLPRSMNDGAVRARLQRTAERYARINVRDNRVEPEEIIVHLNIDRGSGVVDARVEADIGYVLAGWLHDYAGPGEMAQSTGTQSVRQPLSLVLAIDESNSMNNRLDGGWAGRGERSRMDIVRGAATHMVEIVAPDPGTPVKVGLVPWSIDLGMVLEPSTDPVEIRRALAALDAHGQATRSFVGLVRAREFLEDEPEEIHRAIVLLTDGEDNRDERGQGCWSGAPRCTEPRREQCAGARNDGAEIFVVAAMIPREMSNVLGRELRRCATSECHVFAENFTPLDLEEAFAEIAGRLRGLRRIN